jgi:hypothetical protein
VTRTRGMVIAWMPRNQRTRSLAAALGYEAVLVGRPGYRHPWSAPLAPWADFCDAAR